jgi:hypothetical protein
MFIFIPFTLTVNIFLASFIISFVYQTYKRKGKDYDNKEDKEYKENNENNENEKKYYKTVIKSLLFAAVTTIIFHIFIRYIHVHMDKNRDKSFSVEPPTFS